MSVRVSAIAAIEQYNRGLGKNNKVVWNIPEDQKYFADKIKGHVVIMGRKTYEQINKKPLNAALNIVVTRQKNLNTPGFVFVNTIDEAIKLAKNNEMKQEIFIVGGGEIYKLAMPYTDRLYLTMIDGIYNGMDAFFPDYSRFAIVSQDHRNNGGMKYTFTVLEK